MVGVLEDEIKEDEKMDTTRMPYPEALKQHYLTEAYQLAHKNLLGAAVLGKSGMNFRAANWT